ncbi:hypothetical protein BpOF4_20239 (plasmid) [Alkalihalophilus pseudofirmus OF4]|uniref:Uncharacterized protein n=1 Tax=Alkalihalophilus pseudofirmus (strain ATCC BAA-2126 / JCM 17055 / OF4) TaxID=398511 RepID=D3G121_ALKPO|nr:hypothetical protein [Alkalihalophilus pseudofirmus]ADC52047.1 hypothetical protein BpOF4_20239 [Alkalihalophilus pseudofirmus OF4]
MRKKTKMLLFSFGLSSVLVVGTMGFSGISQANENHGMMNMMEGMNSLEGENMMEACNNFMESYGSDETETN